LSPQANQALPSHGPSSRCRWFVLRRCSSVSPVGGHHHRRTAIQEFSFAWAVGSAGAIARSDEKSDGAGRSRRDPGAGLPQRHRNLHELAQTARSLVNPWSIGPFRIYFSAKCLFLLALPRGLEPPVFAVRGRGSGAYHSDVAPIEGSCLAIGLHLLIAL